MAFHTENNGQAGAVIGHGGTGNTHIIVTTPYQSSNSADNQASWVENRRQGTTGFVTLSPFSPGGWFGPHAYTHIRNKYHEAIWVNVSVDDRIGMTAQPNDTVSAESFRRFAMRNGLTRVAANSTTKFTPGNGIVYISIWKDSGDPICIRFTRPQNGSAMVDAGGFVNAGINGDGKD